MIYLFIGLLIIICIWLADQSLKHSEKNFHLKTELEIYKELDRANNLANKVLRQHYSTLREKINFQAVRNCELIDKLNAAKSKIEDLTDARNMERKKKLDVMREYDLEVLEKENEELKQMEWGERERLMYHGLIKSKDDKVCVTTCS